jgi:hypothetical protein
MSERSNRIAMALRRLVRQAAVPILTQKFDVHANLNELEEISDSVAIQAAGAIRNDLEVLQLLAENEIVRPDGKLNADAVVECMRRMLNEQKGGKRAELEHLISHFQNTMISLRCFKESDSDVQKETPYLGGLSM